MKKGAVVFTSLALLAAFCLPAVAQPSNRAVETIVVDNFDENDTLRIGDGTGTYSTQVSGSDVVVHVGMGYVRLRNAASLSTISWKTKERISITG